MIGSVRRVSRETLLLPVHVWRLISRLLPPRCKFSPTCSAYAIDAVRSRGVVVGSALACWRVLRCHPWSLGGIDPVPAHRSPRHLPTSGADHP